MTELAFHSLHYSPMFGSRVPLTEVLDAAARAGFRYIGLDQPSVEAYLRGKRDENALAADLDGRDLRCSDLAVLRVGADERQVVAEAARLGDLAAVLSAPTVVAAVVTPHTTESLADVVGRCADVVGSRVRLGLEFSAYTELATLADATAISAQVGWNRVGIVVDSLQLFRTGADSSEIMRLRGDQITAVQFTDGVAAIPADLAADSRRHRLVPGTGDLPLHDFVAAIRAADYRGPVTAEVLSTELRQRDPFETATSIFHAMAGYWQ